MLLRRVDGPGEWFPRPTSAGTTNGRCEMLALTLTLVVIAAATWGAILGLKAAKK